MTIVYFLLILSFLVIIHELGHFLTAKKAGIKVEEFGIGYPPKAITLYTDKAGTQYTFNWLPFGGFVRLYGEDGMNTAEATDAMAFFNKPVLWRMMVVAAGALVNFAFGVLAFGAIYSHVGIPTDFGHIRVDEVAQSAPASEAGIEVLDQIGSVSYGDQTVDVETFDSFVTELGRHRGETVSLYLINKDKSVDVYVRREDEVPEGEGAIGVTVSDYELRQYPWWQMPVRGMWVGLKSAIGFSVFLLQSLGDMMADLVLRGQVPTEVAGPVGIVDEAGKQGILTQGWLDRLNFAAIISINLAIVNMLPIPALDGGRFVFLVYEGLTKRRIGPELERKINTYGFVTLLGLIILITIRDIRNIIVS